MKYVITAKGSSNVNGGNGSFIGGTPIQQTESATELIINRMALISYLKDGIVDYNTTIVTLEERKFLYEHIFKNVENYDPSKSYENSIDFVTERKLDELCGYLPYKPFYGNFERDKNELLNIQFNENIINSDLPDFLVCIPRMKNSDTRRNLDQNYWIEFLGKAKSKYKKIFVFGKGNENMQDDVITYVDTLLDYCSYIHHPNCVDIVSTISGPCHYAQHFSNTSNKTNLTMIDNNGLIEKHGNDPSYFHPCINFTNIKINFVKTLVSPDELLNAINNY